MDDKLFIDMCYNNVNIRVVIDKESWNEKSELISDHIINTINIMFNGKNIEKTVQQSAGRLTFKDMFGKDI